MFASRLSRQGADMAAKSKRQPVRQADDLPIGNAVPRSSQQGPLGPAAWARHPAVLAGVLMLLVVLAYLPALRCGFIWDDDAYVTQNPMLTAANGWREIWFSAHTQSQYFPLVYTTFRLERDLWGLNP